MNIHSKLNRLASRFERKLALAQLQTAQKGDIDAALYKNNVRPEAPQLAPFLDAARVPENARVAIGINVDKNLGVKFYTQPRFPTLEAKLNTAFSNKMQAALKTSGLSVADVIQMGLATF